MKATLPAFFSVSSVESPRTFQALLPSSARLLTRPLPRCQTAPVSAEPFVRSMSSAPLSISTSPVSPEALASKRIWPVSIVVVVPPEVTSTVRAYSSTPSSALPSLRAVMSLRSSVIRWLPPLTSRPTAFCVSMREPLPRLSVLLTLAAVP